MKSPSSEAPKDFDFGVHFESSARRVKGERDKRLAAAKRELPFGHAFLDDCLRSIMPNDLIVIGARTGVGKSELARSICSHNARMGKRVHYFALEAEQLEIERRTKFGVVAGLVFKYQVKFDGVPFNYPDWYRGRFDQRLGDIEDEADAIVADKYSTLFTYYRGERFDAQDIRRLVLAEQDNTDLIAIDHLHYIDLDESGKQTENVAMRELVMTIRNTALLAGLPVILVVHLRKKETSGARSKALVPIMDDVHGSSEIAKVCTHAIMLEPAFSVPSRKNMSNTFFAVPKDRGDGAKHLVALCAWDWRRKSYEDVYTLGREKKGEFEPLSRDEAPYWATHHEGLATPMEAGLA